MLRKKAEYERGEKGEILMTPHNLRLFCLEDELYEYPELLILKFICITRVLPM